MPSLRSKVITHGRNMAGARSLLRAAGVDANDFGKPIIAVVNSFCQFVPGHTHLAPIGRLVSEEIQKAGGIAREFNTIAIDDGIAMGHDGMLYSLPSRELIADSVEYVVNAHKADAMVCISNCDKITPGMLLAAMRLNIPCVFVSGGPMEGGTAKLVDGTVQKKVELISVMASSANPNISDANLLRLEAEACPTCGSCSGMFTANSMNCLTEVLGLSLPANGTTLATHTARRQLFIDASYLIVDLCKRYYKDGDESVLPKNIATYSAFQNAMAVDIAMGGSTNTILHLLAIAKQAGVDYTLKDINELSKRIPCLCKVAPNGSYLIEDVHRAGGIPAILGELYRAGLLETNVKSVHSDNLTQWLNLWDIRSENPSPNAEKLFLAAPGCEKSIKAFSQSNLWQSLDKDATSGCIRDVDHAYSADGGLAVLYGNIARDGCVVKTAGVDKSILTFEGKAFVTESQEEAVEAILNNSVKSGDIVVVRYEGPRGGPGMQEMLYPTSFLKGKGLGKECALITDGRFSGGTSGLSIVHISPEAASGGLIALVKTGDIIKIDIPSRTIHLDVPDNELLKRKIALEASGGYKPKNRNRNISYALKLYGALATSADKGAIRDNSKIDKIY